MTDIVNLIAPVFILIGLGYLSVKLGWLAQENTRVLAWFVISFGVPAALFKALGNNSFDQILRLDYLLVFSLGTLMTFGIILSIAKLMGKNLTTAAIYAMGASVPNSIMIGYPIVYQLFGEVALIAFSLTIIVENMLIIPLALALADTGKKQDAHFISVFGKSILELIKNPIILAIIFGLFFSILSLQLPTAVNSVINLLASTVSAVSLFAVGGMLFGIKPKGMIGDASLVAVGKLLVHPLMIIAVSLIIPIKGSEYQSIAIILAAMPMFSIFAALGSRYSLGEICSTTLLITTTASFITISVFLSIWS